VTQIVPATYRSTVPQDLAILRKNKQYATSCAKKRKEKKKKEKECKNLYFSCVFASATVGVCFASHSGKVSRFQRLSVINF
jgi:hypothetical protein